MKINVNGKVEQVDDCSVYSFIVDKGLKPDSVIIEYNFKILKKHDWKDTYLKDNDNLEVLSFVGGG